MAEVLDETKKNIIKPQQKHFDIEYKYDDENEVKSHIKSINFLCLGEIC